MEAGGTRLRDPYRPERLRMASSGNDVHSHAVAASFISPATPPPARLAGVALHMREGRPMHESILMTVGLNEASS